MKVLLQRVSHAQVTVDGDCVGRIGQGLLLFVGVARGDDRETARRAIDRVLRYRVFADQTGRTNLSVEDAGGALLLVSQFTLTADTARGLRPGFSQGAAPDQARDIFHYMVDYATDLGRVPVAAGRFGADMKVGLLNDGPVTFLLEF